ncbi:hypothetical protein BC828DRAFT_383035 [Blastocladiella britannica]|nr:hypothetical protein BC828DRAFT_383035 [Blastocladiella britannica]
MPPPPTAYDPIRCLEPSFSPPTLEKVSPPMHDGLGNPKLYRTWLRPLVPEPTAGSTPNHHPYQQHLTGPLPAPRSLDTSSPMATSRAFRLEPVALSGYPPLLPHRSVAQQRWADEPSSRVGSSAGDDPSMRNPIAASGRGAASYWDPQYFPHQQQHVPPPYSHPHSRPRGPLVPRRPLPITTTAPVTSAASWIVSDDGASEGAIGDRRMPVSPLDAMDYQYYRPQQHQYDQYYAPAEYPPPPLDPIWHGPSSRPLASLPTQVEQQQQGPAATADPWFSSARHDITGATVYSPPHRSYPLPPQPPLLRHHQHEYRDEPFEHEAYHRHHRHHHHHRQHHRHHHHRNAPATLLPWSHEHVSPIQQHQFQPPPPPLRRSHGEQPGDVPALSIPADHGSAATSTRLLSPLSPPAISPPEVMPVGGATSEHHHQSLPGYSSDGVSAATTITPTQPQLFDPEADRNNSNTRRHFSFASKLMLVKEYLANTNKITMSEFSRRRGIGVGQMSRWVNMREELEGIVSSGDGTKCRRPGAGRKPQPRYG